jgi:hypothetical protein
LDLLSSSGVPSFLSSCRLLIYRNEAKGAAKDEIINPTRASIVTHANAPFFTLKTL